MQQYTGRKVYESTSRITNSMTDRKYKYTHRTDIQGSSSGMSAPNSAYGLPRRAPVRTKYRTIPDLGCSTSDPGCSLPDLGCSIPDLGYYIPDLGTTYLILGTPRNRLCDTPMTYMCCTHAHMSHSFGYQNSVHVLSNVSPISSSPSILVS